MKSAISLLPVLLVAAAPAHAGEVFGGIYAHDVKLPTDKSGIESGADIQLGYRGGGSATRRIQPYVFGALNTAGEHELCGGRPVGEVRQARIYIRPGLGIAIHNGSAANNSSAPTRSLRQPGAVRARARRRRAGQRPRSASRRAGCT